MDALLPHLPVLLVLTPLFGGLLAALMPRRGPAPWIWSALVTGFEVFLALSMVKLVRQSPQETISYFIGWWPAEYGIAYEIDALNAYVILVVALLAFVSTIYAKSSVEDEIPKDRHNFFYSIWLLAISGMVGICATADTFNIYVLLEISSLTVYTLIAMGKYRDRRALTASLKYLILGSIGATFILLGIGYLLMLTGTLNMADMHEQLMLMKAKGDLAGNRTILVGFTFITVGLGLKMAMWPLHLWLPNAYTFAPSAVSALVASTATKVGVYMAFRFIFTLFGSIYDSSATLALMAFCGTLGIIVSSIRAAQATNVKKILAYSSVGQLGYIVVGFSMANESGVAASVIHILNHAVTKGAMFMACGAVVLRMGNADLKSFYGLGRRMPATMAAFTIGGLGLIGMPLTSGFISKFYLISGALHDGKWWLAMVVLAGSLISIVYVWRVIEAIYFRKPDKRVPVEEAPFTMLIAMWILASASVILGVDAELTGRLAEYAARVLIGGAT
jgi:multicomponent Na+:H+ antiporter subunit D